MHQKLNKIFRTSMTMSQVIEKEDKAATEKHNRNLMKHFYATQDAESW
jgi:hypothetical protein